MRNRLPLVYLKYSSTYNSLEILLSNPLFLEYREVVVRKKFIKKYKPEIGEMFLERLLKRATLINTTSTITDCRDPKDNMLLELAVDGKADCIITGDKLVLELHPFRGIPILKPSDFLDWMGDKNA